jgi:hypothetical protein
MPYLSSVDFYKSYCSENVMLNSNATAVSFCMLWDEEKRLSFRSLLHF